MKKPIYKYRHLKDQKSRHDTWIVFGISMSRVKFMLRDGFFQMKYRVRGWFKNPFVLRRTLEKAQRNHDLELASVRERHQREMEGVQKELDDLLPRMVRFQIEPVYEKERYPPTQTYRLVVEFEDHFVWEMFEHGDNRRIDAIVYSVARNVGAAMRQMNFGRWHGYETPIERDRRRHEEGL